MREAGVVVDIHGQVAYLHRPQGRTGGSLPDDRNLWEVLWLLHSCGTLSGFAHSHPGAGPPSPSHEDVTTFAAIEKALGRRIDWWIVTRDQIALYDWQGPGEHDYRGTLLVHVPSWADLLRRASYE